MPTSRLEVDLRAVDRNLEVVRSVLAPAGMATRAPEPRSARSSPGVCAILKQDGYGVGAVRLAKRLAAGVEMFGVYSLDEARALYEAVPRTPILVLMPVSTMDRHDPLYRAAAEGRLHLVLHDHDQLDGLTELTGRIGVGLPVHVQLDTGLSRGGLAHEGARELVERIVGSQRLLLAGVMTHFASPCTDGAFTAEQAERFSAFMADIAPVLRAALVAGHNPPRPARESFVGTGGLAELAMHMANTCATFRSRALHGTMVRVGQCLLGYALDEAMIGHTRPRHATDDGPGALDDFEFAADARRLVPAVRWTSYASHVQEIDPGWPVGYGSTWRAPKRSDGRRTRIALIPVGYADGYPRALSSSAVRRPLVHTLPNSADRAQGVLAWVGFTGRPWERRGAGAPDDDESAGTNTVYAPVVGRVSMDQITVDVTDVPEAFVRSADTGGPAMEVELLGRDPLAPNYPPTLAAAAGSITHELLCRVSARIERVYRYPATTSDNPAVVSIAGGVPADQGVVRAARSA